MEPLNYYSTNLRAEPVSFGEALLQGQAPDRGFTCLSRFLLSAGKRSIGTFVAKSYPEIAFEVLQRIFAA
jgi:threonine synthase